MTDKFWSLRDEIVRSAHRWPSLLSLTLLGFLAGWLLSWLWPPTYRATSQVYVALNPYRTYSDTRFLALVNPKYSNIDNYNYWQMSELEAVIFRDEFIQETLDRLRQADSYWNSVNIDALRNMLNADWRSAGTWSLVAENRQRAYALQAAQAWGEVAVQRVRVAIDLAQDTIQTDQELQAVKAKLLDLRLRQQTIVGIKSSLATWVESATLHPAEQPLETNQRWKILAEVSQAAQFSPAWNSLLQDQPQPTSPRQDYVQWINQIILVLDDELLNNQALIGRLENEQSRFSEQLYNQIDASLGLSPNLNIKSLEHLEAKVIRPRMVFILVGSIIGLLSWLAWQLVLINQQRITLIKRSTNNP